MNTRAVHTLNYANKDAFTTHLLMPVLGRKHQRRESLVLLRLEIRLRLDKGASDLLVVV